MKIEPLKKWMIAMGAEIQYPKYGFWFIKLYRELGDDLYSIELIITTDDWDINIHKAKFNASQYIVFYIHDIDLFIDDLIDKAPIEDLLGQGNCMVNKYDIEGNKIAEIGGHWGGPKNLYKGESKYYGLKEFLDAKDKNKYGPSAKRDPKSKSKAKKKKYWL